MKSLIHLTGVLLCILVTACGGGGGGSSTSSSASSFSQTYTASASAGEVISYTFNSTNKTYSYTITQSAYGLTGTTGNGTLTLNSDGSYAPSESPTTKIYAAQNGLLVGRVRLNLNGTNRDVPLLGVSNPATSGTDLAGTYNYISLQCAAKNFGVFTGCLTSYGSLAVVSTGANSATWTSCPTGNITAGVGGCAGISTGNLTHTSGGIWKAIRTGSTNESYMVGFKSSNGQKVGYLDLNDLGGYGFGQAIMSEQVNTSISDVVGKYVAHSTYGGVGTVDILANSTTSNGNTLSANTPWLGMVKTSAAGGEGFGILAGTGVYAYRDPQLGSGYFEIGMRQ